MTDVFVLLLGLFEAYSGIGYGLLLPESLLARHSLSSFYLIRRYES